jgi:hypothetical protein
LRCTIKSYIWPRFAEKQSILGFTPMIQLYQNLNSSFVRAASQRCSEVSSTLITNNSNGKPLTTDIALIGAKGADTCIIVLSGVHGVEGAIGSSIQTRWLREGSLTPGVAICLIHCVNPYGLAEFRRVNENNIDINRNFLDFPIPSQINNSHSTSPKLDQLKWSELISTEKAIEDIVKWVNQVGLAEAQSAITAGQYINPNQLFYGGNKASRSRLLIEQSFAALTRRFKRFIVLDIHSGLGAYGEMKPIHEGGNTGFGNIIFPNLLLAGAAGGLSSNLNGTLTGASPKMLRNLPTESFVLELGTYSPITLFAAMQRELWAHLYSTDYSLKKQVRLELLEMFYPNDSTWRQQAEEQVLSSIEQAQYASIYWDTACQSTS